MNRGNGLLPTVIVRDIKMISTRGTCVSSLETLDPTSLKPIVIHSTAGRHIHWRIRGHRNPSSRDVYLKIRWPSSSWVQPHPYTKKLSLWDETAAHTIRIRREGKPSTKSKGDEGGRMGPPRMKYAPHPRGKGTQPAAKLVRCGAAVRRSLPLLS